MVIESKTVHVLGIQLWLHGTCQSPEGKEGGQCNPALLIHRATLGESEAEPWISRRSVEEVIQLCPVQGSIVVSVKTSEQGNNMLDGLGAQLGTPLRCNEVLLAADPLELLVEAELAQDCPRRLGPALFDE